MFSTIAWVVAAHLLCTALPCSLLGFAELVREIWSDNSWMLFRVAFKDESELSNNDWLLFRWEGWILAPSCKLLVLLGRSKSSR